MTNGAGSSRASSKPAIADLNGDGALEIVVGSNVLSSAGTVLGGWEGGRPEALNSLSAALADMDGDASNGREIVLGKYAWHADGTSVSGFPLGMALSAPVVADCGGHDHLDVLAGTRNIPSAPGVTGFHAEADPHAIDGYPKSLYGETGDIGAPVVGDFDNDGLADVAVAITDGSYGGVVAIYDMPFENHDERHEWPMLGRDVARTGFLDVTPPNRPRDLVVGNAATGIELRWQERSAVEDGYLVERSASGEPWSYVTVAADLPADTSTFTDADVIFGEVYFYRVRAFRVAHGARLRSQQSNVASVAADIKPIAEAGPPQTVAAGAWVRLDGSASYDPDGGPDELGFRWRFLSGPETTQIRRARSPRAQFKAPPTPGAYRFQLQVDDGSANGRDTDRVRITVVP